LPSSGTARPRVVVAGTGGDSGKTLVSLGLCLAWRDEGTPVVAFKKGPDYIDAAWLSWASGSPARNLDSYLMGFDGVADAFGANATTDGFNVIEGNRGLFDGAGVHGVHSTAELARHLAAPVIPVVDVTKSTRTVAALVYGLVHFDERVPVAGVILNRVGSARHERVIRGAIEERCGIPVLGALRRMHGGDPLPGRHLGLVTVQESGGLDEVAQRLRAVIRDQVDLAAIGALAAGAPPIDATVALRSTVTASGGPAPTVGVIRDSAFAFYYPENLEALEAAGAELAFFSAVRDGGLPAMDALYIGGGFPETHAGQLAANRGLLASIREAAAAGLPIYAECGGLMVLCRSFRWQGEVFPMAGVLPLDLVVDARPQGHGYAEARVDGPNPIFEPGTVVRGHEFHYSRVDGEPPDGLRTAYAMQRGTGTHAGRDGVVVDNVLASYVHLHARGCPQWAPGFARRAREYRTSQ